MLSWKFIFLYFLILVVAPAYAQVKFTTVINNREIGKNDYLQVEYLVENANSVQSITPPSFTGFTLMEPPSEQTGMSYINGAMSRYQGVTYVLKPSATGKFMIGGANAIVDGHNMHSSAVEVVVTNRSSTAPQPSQSPFFGLNVPEEIPEVDEEFVLKKDENASEKIKGNILVKLDVNKTSCYTGEPIVATYRLYSRLKSESRVTRRPSLSQFSVYDMVQPEADNASIEKLNGKIYNAHIIRKVQLYPLQDGHFELDPVEVDNTIQFLRLQEGSNKASVREMLDHYMSGMADGKMEEEKITLSSKPITIDVKPLPAEGRPVFFDGAVGKFTLNAMIPKASIEAGEPAVLMVTVKGQGNLTLINAPQVEWPSDVTGYDASVQENLDKTVAPISGVKKFEYTFTAKHAGHIVIPPIRFAYFDPARNSYQVLHTDSLETDISPSTKKPKLLNAFVRTKEAGGNEPNWPLILGAIAVIILTILTIVVIKTKKKTIPAPVATVPSPSPVAPVDPLAGAREALAAMNSQLFYSETGKAIWQWLDARFALNASQHNKSTVVRLMQESGASTQTITLFSDVLRDCELALYTPVHTEHDMQVTLQKAEQLRDNLNTA